MALDLKKIIFFISPKKMNPEKISISDIYLQDPVKRSTGKITYCLLPCSNNDKRFQLKLQTKFQIFAHEGNSFSLGITLPEENIPFFRELETHLNSAAVKKQAEVKKLAPSCSKFHEGDFTLLKLNKSEQEKIYAKIYPSKIPKTDFSCRFWELIGGKKKPILNQKQLIGTPLYKQVVFPLNIFSVEM